MKRKLQVKFILKIFSHRQMHDFLLLGVTALGVIMKFASLFNSQLKTYSEYGGEGILIRCVQSPLGSTTAMP